MDGRRYSIGELAELTGVSRRTVHFYVQRRLIDAPLGRGRGRHYDERHVSQILEVRALQAMGMPLADMRRGPEPGGEAASRQPVAATEVERTRASLAGVGRSPAGQPVSEVPSVTPSIMSVVRVRVAENVTLELAPGALAPTAALVADLAAAVAGVLGAHAAAGASAAPMAHGVPARGAAGDGGLAREQEEDQEEES